MEGEAEKEEGSWMSMRGSCAVPARRGHGSAVIPHFSISDFILFFLLLHILFFSETIVQRSALGSTVNAVDTYNKMPINWIQECVRVHSENLPFFCTSTEHLGLALWGKCEADLQLKLLLTRNILKVEDQF